MSVNIVSAFQSAGTPATGLTPHITIYDLADDSAVVNAAEMSEIANGLYKYAFATYDPKKDYAIYVDGGDTLAATDRYQYVGGSWDGAAALIEKILRNKTVTDPGTSQMIVYDDDGITPLFTASIKQDSVGSIPYADQGIDYRDRLE